MYSKQSSNSGNESAIKQSTLSTQYRKLCKLDYLTSVEKFTAVTETQRWLYKWTVIVVCSTSFRHGNFTGSVGQITYDLQYHTITAYHNYLCQEGYVIVVVCLLATLRKNFQMDLHEIFRGRLALDRWINDQNLVAIRITDQHPYHNTGKTCLGGGM